VKKLTTAVAILGTVPLLVAVALTVTDIVLRSFTSHTVHGLTDIVTLCTMIGAMFAIPFGFSHNQHVAIDVFTTHMPRGLQRVLLVIAALLGFFFLAAVFWFSIQQMMTEYGYGDRSQSIGIPMVWYWIPLVVGIGLAAIVNAWLVVRHARGLQEGDRS
jgi:TRAP-type C4-dicarboxylate transport system permease small subunit